MINDLVGSNFDDFLAEEGILAETEISRRMNNSRAALNRLLDPENQAVTLQTLDRAAHALGKRL